MPHGYTKILQKNFPGDLTQPTYRKYHTIGKIRVFSIGWYSQGAKWNRNPDVLLRDLEWRLTVRMHKLPPMDLWMDTRCMYQPPPYSGCVGLNDQELDAFVGHRKFSPWLGMVKNFVQNHEADLALEEKTKDFISIACVCRAGRNRSVSGKTVLDYIFNVLGFEVKGDSGHLSKNGWFSCKRPVCTTCEGCTQPTQLKTRVLVRAFKIWTTLR